MFRTEQKRIPLGVRKGTKGGILKPREPQGWLEERIREYKTKKQQDVHTNTQCSTEKQCQGTFKGNLAFHRSCPESKTQRESINQDSLCSSSHELQLTC